MNLNNLFHKGFFDDEDDNPTKKRVVFDNYTEALLYKANRSANEYCYVTSRETFDIIREKTAFQIYVALFMDNFEIEKESKVESSCGDYPLFKSTLSLIKMNTDLLSPNLLIKILEKSSQHKEIDRQFIEMAYISLINSNVSEEIWNYSIDVINKYKIITPEFHWYLKQPCNLDDNSDLYKDFVMEHEDNISLLGKKKACPLSVIKNSKYHSLETSHLYILEQIHQRHSDE